MARPPRVYAAGHPYHVIHRGDNRQLVFREALDFLLYQDYLLDAMIRYGVRCHAFCQMPNHVHLLLTPGCGEGISQVMSLLGNRFVQNFNARHSRSGTLWEGRHYSSVIFSDDYFWTVCRYIELNPVRAGLAGTPGGYYWSSYAHNAQGRKHTLLSPHPLQLSLDLSREGRQSAYRRMFTGDADEPGFAAVRCAVRRGIALGDSTVGDDAITVTSETRCH